MTFDLKVVPMFSYVWNFRVPINWQPGICRIVSNMNILNSKEKERELARKLNIHGCPFNEDVATFTGNGAQRTFYIAHGLGGTPTSCSVAPGSQAAESRFYVTAISDRHIAVTFPRTPAIGADIQLVWQAAI